MGDSDSSGEQVFAIVRYDGDGGAPELRFTVKEIVRRQEEAEAEVRRLTALNTKKECRYFWQTTRLFPARRSAGKAGETTRTGYINRNRQTVVRSTGLPGTDHLQYVYVVRCGDCGNEYGANGSDIHLRRCPGCQGGAPGLAF
jgi:hypothetical protein